MFFCIYCVPCVPIFDVYLLQVILRWERSVPVVTTFMLRWTLLIQLDDFIKRVKWCRQLLKIEWVKSYRLLFFLVKRVQTRWRGRNLLYIFPLLVPRYHRMFLIFHRGCLKLHSPLFLINSLEHIITQSFLLHLFMFYLPFLDFKDIFT